MPIKTTALEMREMLSDNLERSAKTMTFSSNANCGQSSLGSSPARRTNQRASRAAIHSGGEVARVGVELETSAEILSLSAPAVNSRADCSENARLREC